MTEAQFNLLIAKMVFTGRGMCWAKSRSYLLSVICYQEQKSKYFCPLILVTESPRSTTVKQRMGKRFTDIEQSKISTNSGRQSFMANKFLPAANSGQLTCMHSSWAVGPYLLPTGDRYHTVVGQVPHNTQT